MILTGSLIINYLEIAKTSTKDDMVKTKKEPKLTISLELKTCIVCHKTKKIVSEVCGDCEKRLKFICGPNECIFDSGLAEAI